MGVDIGEGVAGGVRTWIQNPVWRTTDTVLQHILRTHPANYRAQWLMATYLSQQGNREAALDHFRLAIRMVPGYYNLRAEYGRELFLANSEHTASDLRAISTPAPRYPPDALRSGTGGEVQLEFTVAVDGSVSAARVVRATPARTFDREALNAVRRWRFEPVPAPVTTRRTINFSPSD